MPTRPHKALHVRGTGGKEDTFVEEATVTFTEHIVKHRVSTQSELETLKIAGAGEDTEVEGICHFATIFPKNGNSRPFPVYLAALPLYMSKARVVHVRSRTIPGSNVPPTRTMISLQLHCCPLLLNLNGFDLQIVLVYFTLPGQRGQMFVRCHAFSIHKQLHGKNGSPTEGGGSLAAGGGGGGGGGSPDAGAGGRGGEGKSEGNRR